MTSKELLEQLDRWDREGRWAFTAAQLRLLFNRETEPSFNKALHLHARAGLLARAAKGHYYNPRARCLPAAALYTLVDLLRPWDFNYLSLETVLSDAGMISQIPGLITVMSTGRSLKMSSPFGPIEFVHTQRKSEHLAEGVQYDKSRGIHVASPERALKDLRRVGRNLDLVTTGAT